MNLTKEKKVRIGQVSGLTLLAIEKMNKALKWEKGAEKLRAEVGSLMREIPKDELAVYVEYTTERN